MLIEECRNPFRKVSLFLEVLAIIELDYILFESTKWQLKIALWKHHIHRLVLLIVFAAE